MLDEFLLRLAIALPIVCALAALTLLAMKRGWLRLPGLALRSAPANTADTGLAIVAVKSLSPAARVAVVRFAGRELLVGVSGQGLMLLAEQPAIAPAPHALERAA
jgi:flagellar biogenesis protein FliO